MLVLDESSIELILADSWIEIDLTETSVELVARQRSTTRRGGPPDVRNAVQNGRADWLINTIERPVYVSRIGVYHVMAYLSEVLSQY